MNRYYRDYNSALKLAAEQRLPAGTLPTIPNQSDWQNPHAEAIREIHKWDGLESNHPDTKLTPLSPPLHIPTQQGSIVVGVNVNHNPESPGPILVSMTTVRKGRPNADGTSTVVRKGGNMYPQYARQIADKLPPDDAARVHRYLDEHFGPRE